MKLIRISKLFTMSALFLLAGMTTQAQTFFEDFQQGIPSDWTLRNVDGSTPDANVAFVTDAWVTAENFVEPGDSVAFSTSWYDPVGQADDWLITPAITVGANDYLFWDASAPDGAYPDGYTVYVAADTMLSSFLGNTPLFTIAGENEAWTTRFVDLATAGYANTTVYFAFRNNSNNQFLLAIDDVKVDVPPANDLSIASAPYEYTIIPFSQVGPISFSGTVTAEGTAAQTNVTVETSVILVQGGAVTGAPFTGTSNPLATVASLATEPFTTTNTFTPADTGLYVVQMIVSSDSVDQINTNDTAFYIFQVSDSTYARDDSQPTASLGIGGGAGGLLGNMYVLTDTAALSSIGALFTNGFAGATVSAVVYAMDADTPSTVVATCDTVVFAGGQEFIEFIPVNGSVVLEPDSFVVCIVEIDSNVTLATSPDVFTLGAGWVNFPGIPTGGWTNNELFNFLITYVIRPNFNPDCQLKFDFTSTPPDCPGTIGGSAEITVSGGYGNISYLWSNGNTNPLAQGLADQIYTVEATDEFGCSASVTADLTILDTLAAAATGTDATCNGCTDGVADAGATGGTAPYTYLWGDGETTATLTGVAAGTYDVTVTDANGCEATGSVVVDEPVGLFDPNGLMAQFDLYPNPATSAVNINITFNEMQEWIRVDVVNSIGQIVNTASVNNVSAYTNRVDVTELASGTYLINVVTANGTSSTSFIKQ